MCQKTISMCQGKGSLSHNNRAFAAKKYRQFPNSGQHYICASEFA